jgi:hypothetical protein
MAMKPTSGMPGADPWADSKPRCRVHSDAQGFRALVTAAAAGGVILLDNEPAGEREAVLVDCRHAADALAVARHRFARRPLVGIVARFEAARMVELLAQGADGAIALDDPPESWRDCLLVVLGGGRWLGGPGLEISLEQKHAHYEISRGDNHAGDVTVRTKIFVKGRVGDKFAN